MRLRIVFLFALLLRGHDCLAQQTPIAPPDCLQSFNLTARGRAAQIQNGTGCTSWSVVYKSTGFTAVTFRLVASADVSGAPSGWGLFGGSAALTNAQNGVIQSSGYRPWVAVELQELSGSGSVSGVLMGWRYSPATSSPNGSLVSPGLPLPPCNAVRKTNCK